MQRIRSHINRSAGQHLRALRSQHSASLTAEPLLLNTERLHRVDASQLPAGVDGAALGYCRTDMGICMGHPECADRHCQGHPCNDVDGYDDVNTPMTRMEVVSVLLLVAASAAVSVAFISFIWSLF